jgi:hypothetical protein
LPPKAKKKVQEKQPKRTGSGPLFDEQMILDCLAQPTNFDGIGPLQSAAMMTLVDCYDRKVERDFFGNVAATALALHTAMGRLHTISVLRAMVAEPQFKENPEREIDGAIKSLTAHAVLRQKELGQMVHLLVQCPTGEDSIN